MTSTLAEPQKAGQVDRDGLLAIAQRLGPLRTREARILDTWDSLGMRGTDSNDVVVDDVFAGGEPSSLEQKADLLLAAVHAATTAGTVTDMMHKVAGTSGIYTRSPLERHFRDAQTLRHHGFMSENRFEAVGQVYCGVEPEFAMVAF
jgi:alkylation response protein AidB-like acyl-CoA dehydrogenase